MVSKKAHQLATAAAKEAAKIAYASVMKKVAQSMSHVSPDPSNLSAIFGMDSNVASLLNLDGDFSVASARQVKGAAQEISGGSWIGDRDPVKVGLVLESLDQYLVNPLVTQYSSAANKLGFKASAFDMVPGGAEYRQALDTAKRDRKVAGKKEAPKNVVSSKTTERMTKTASRLAKRYQV